MQYFILNRSGNYLTDINGWRNSVDPKSILTSTTLDKALNFSSQEDAQQFKSKNELLKDFKIYQVKLLLTEVI